MTAADINLFEAIAERKDSAAIHRVCGHYGADPNSKDMTGTPAFIRTIEIKHFKAGDALIAWGADIYGTREENYDAMRTAVFSMRSIEAVEYLIGKGYRLQDRAIIEEAREVNVFENIIQALETIAPPAPERTKDM